MGPLCGFEGCGRPLRANGLCMAHYNQLRRNPDAPLTPVRARRPDGEGLSKSAREMVALGLTPDEYHARLEAQGGVCAICAGPPVGKPRFSIDHDHSCCPTRRRSCGACVRGLLCNRCNIGIGMFKDNPVLLHAAAVYLGSASS